MSFLPTTGRGHHWSAKIAQGTYVEPSVYTKEWAEKRSGLETKFNELMAKLGKTHTLPWHRTDRSIARSVGNTNKVLFMELIAHHYNQTAQVSFVDDDHVGFLGITAIAVTPENRAAFDAGIIPSIHSKRIAGGSRAQIKTLGKIWNVAGFAELALENGGLSYVFDRATYDRMQRQAHRADVKRNAKKKEALQSQLSPITVTTLFQPIDTQPTPVIPVTGIDALLMAAQLTDKRKRDDASSSADLAARLADARSVLAKRTAEAMQANIQVNVAKAEEAAALQRMQLAAIRLREIEAELSGK